ncbi:Ger(x)C family spore germination protein [Bacillus sp. EB600]|uniref:Ger(x)C family spore germination protein n=1 Tax=Bacillus sp. EB600 TaxID=2806345 RepID=UPI0021098E37|nr:Ger(x)C family spore germination protein [Bacillus sp. EB600]MCQ6279223.1 Ger(x)C family spore germination protein [Bacillus sp. EB600]
MKKKSIIFLVIVLTIPMLEGCWNQEELTDLAFVTALGIDKAEHNQGYTLTFQIVNPGNVASPLAGGGQGSPVAIYKSTGRNVFEAARKATKELSRRIYFPHLSALVISEQVARDGIYDLLDILDRDPGFRTTSQIFIAKHMSAESVVSTLTILDKIPVNKLVKAMDVTETMLGENTKITIDDLLKSMVSSGQEPIANGVTLIGNKKMGKKMSNIASDMPEVIIKIDGLAIFRGGKMIGWIKGNRARGIVWVMNKVKGTDVFVDWQGKKQAIGATIRRSKVNVSAAMKNGKPFIQVAIKAEGDIEQVNGAVDITNPAIIKKIEEKLEQEIKKEVSQSIRTAQSKKSDIFGFGDKIHKTYPKRWKKWKGNWDEQFAALEVSVKADAYLRRHGIRNNPFWLNLNR